MNIYHKHHIIPKHIGGTDDPSNLIELTIEEHAEAHKELYEKYNRWQDYCAWQSLSGQITCAEATKMAQSLSNIGIKNAMYGKTGKLNPNYKNRGTNSPLYGTKQPKEWNIKKAKSLSQAMKGKWKPPKKICRLFDKKEMAMQQYMCWLNWQNKKYGN